MKALRFVLFSAIMAFAIASCKNNTPAVEEGSSNAKLSGHFTTTGDIKWSAQGVGHGHNGTVAISNSDVTFTDGVLSGANFTVDMKSMKAEDLAGDSVQHAKLIGHLMAPDFFGVDSFPTATFTMKSLANNEVTGDMTIKGITNPVKFPVTVVEDSTGFTISGNLDVDRTLYNVQFGSAKFFDIKKLGDHLVEDIMKLSFELKGNK